MTRPIRLSGADKEDATDLDEQTISDVSARLKRIEGQVGGILRMLDSRRECRDVVLQMSAASKALDQAAFKLLASGMRRCLEDEKGAAREGYTEQELEKLFMRLA